MSLEIFLYIEIFLLLHYMVGNSIVIIMNNFINYRCWSHTYVKVNDLKVHIDQH